MKKRSELEDPNNLATYQDEFSEESFWMKVRKYAKKIGAAGIYTVFLLYYTFRKPDLPLKARSTILGALGYFIMPIDFIPDMTPIIGYTDDMVALTGALLLVAAYIDDSTKAQARARVQKLLGQDIQDDIQFVDDKVDQKSSTSS